MIILASQSPTRQTLMKKAGINFTAQTSPLDEEQAKQSLLDSSPPELAQKLAYLKAAALQNTNPPDLIIGVDQVLSLDDQIFHKPRTTFEAQQQLQKLRGKSHQLHTAVVVLQQGIVRFAHLDTTTLTMRVFSDAFLQDYVEARGTDLLTTVGGYKIEENGINLFDKIDGDFFSILGLPLLPLLAFLRETGEMPR